MEKEDTIQEVLPAVPVSLADLPLSAKEEEFCDLYVRGGAEFAGQQTKCYREVFGQDGRNIYAASHRLAREPRIQCRVKEMTASAQFEAETIAVKMQVAETLKAVMEETSTLEFTDRFGVPQSPAPLRAVAVNAAKALMELYPIKHASESRLKIENGQGGVIFNVIVPQNALRDENDPA